MKNVSIVLKPLIIDEFQNILPQLVNLLTSHDKNIFFIDKEEPRLKRIFKTIPEHVLLIEEAIMHHNSDLIISLGGDGTLIGVCRNSCPKTPPVLGVNMGRLGFITEFTIQELINEIHNIFNEEIQIRNLNLFNVEVKRGKETTYTGQFLNDVSVAKGDISRLFQMTVETETQHIFNLAGDGVIISSPVGSTAYSLSAGGPILHPDLKSLVITPICPHSIAKRPIVVPENYQLCIRILTENYPSILTLDGQDALEISSLDSISIRKNTEITVKLIKNPQSKFFHTLAEKLSFREKGVF